MKSGLFIYILAALICTSAFSQNPVWVNLTEEGRIVKGNIHSVLDSSIMLSNTTSSKVNENNQLLKIPSTRINSIEFTSKEFSPGGMFLAGLGGAAIGAISGFLIGLSQTKAPGDGFVESSINTVIVYPITGIMIGGLGGIIIGAITAKKTVFDPLYIYGEHKNYQNNRELIKQKAGLMF